MMTAVPGAPGSIAVGSRNVWISLPNRGKLVRFNPLTGRRRVFPADGGPTAIAAGVSALWVAETATRALAKDNGDSGERVRVTTLSGTPSAVTVDQHHSSAWDADSNGVISHVALGGGVIGSPSRLSPAATSIAWGEGWLWATNSANKGLIRVGLGTAGSSTAYDVGPQPVAVALNQGVWTAHATGHVTRFSPLPDHLHVNADITLPAELDSITATEQGRFVWAISKRAKALYRITNTSTPTVTGTVTFPSPPVALAAAPGSVWVATQDGEVIQTRFSPRAARPAAATMLCPDQSTGNTIDATAGTVYLPARLRQLHHGTTSPHVAADHSDLFGAHYATGPLRALAVRDQQTHVQVSPHDERPLAATITITSDPHARRRRHERRAVRRREQRLNGMRGTTPPSPMRSQADHRTNR